MKLTNGKEIYITNDVTIIDAFKTSGYSEVIDKPKGRKKKEE